jgi:PAS domain S-box-containing protein
MTSKTTFFTGVGGWVRNPLQAFRDAPLGIKLILLFLVVTVLAAGPISVLAIRATTAALAEQVGEGLVAVAETQAQNIGTVLAQRVIAMDAFALDEHPQAAVAAQNAAYSGGTREIEAELARLDEQWVAAGDDDPLIQERLGSAVAHELDHFTYVVPDLAEAFLTDRYGGLVAASDRTSDYYQADEEWWQAAYNNGQGAVFIAEPELDESAGVIGIDMAVPVYASNGAVIGVLRTTVDVTTLLAEFQVEMGETGEVDVVFPSGQVFGVGGGIHAAGEAHEHELDPAMLAQLDADPHGHIEAIYDEVPSVIGRGEVVSVQGQKFISDLGWKVVAHQERVEALAPVWQTRNAIIVLAVVVAVVASVAAIGFGRTVANPVARLTDAVKRFSAGDMSARAESNSRDEIGTLAINFNEMAERVGGLMADIQKRSAELAERTRELEASQRVTFAASERATPEELLSLVVELIRDQFNLYHAQVYIVDEEEQAAVLRQSTGYAGRQLLQRKHQIPLDATALVTKAIHTGEPVLVDDTSKDPNFMPNPLLPETRSELVVPLKLKDQIIGVLDAQDRTPGRFGESTINLFQSMTDQVAILFENSELIGRITEQTEAMALFTNQLRTAAEIARRLGTILDPEQLARETVELLQSRFGLYHAHIYLLDKEARKLRMHIGSGEVGRVLKERGHAIDLDAEKSLVARAARGQRPVAVADTSLESDFMPNPLLPETRSEVAVPLVVGDHVLGVLDVQDNQPNRFSQADVDTFSTLAGQIATALQTAALFGQTQTRLRVSQALTGAQTEEQVLDVLMQQAGLYPKTQAMIFLDDWEGEEQFLVLRRSQSFESRLAASLQPGIRFPASQFQMVTQHSSPDGMFVSSNLPVDERADPVAREMATQMGTVSMATVPLTVGDEQIGSLSVSSEEEGYFDEQKLQLYRTLAEQGATALQIARLHDEMVRSEEALRRLGSAVEQSVDGTAVADMDGIIQFVNPAWAEMHGYSPEEALGKPLSIFHTEEQLQEDVTPFNERVMKTGANQGEVGHVRRDGTTFPTWMSTTVIKDENGNPVGLVGTARDTTEQKRAEQALRDADRLKSEFLASMSHELRTPLNSIIGYTEIMLMGIDSELDSELREDVQAIYDNGKHLLRIINDVLDLAKIEAGRLEMNMDEVPVEALIDQASSSVAGLLINKPVEFNVEVEEDLPVIRGDQVRLNQILNNITSNAVKFTEEGHITLRAFSDDGWVCLEVEDTGIGIKEDNLERIFDRFQQIDGSNARQQEGTGLGLAITRHLVQLHGGTIGVQSKVGEGSTFTVRLPMGHQAATEITESGDGKRKQK